MANSLLMSKLNYNLEVWGKTSKTNLNKIDKILIEASKVVLGKESIGRSNKWLFAKMKWLPTNENYEFAVQKTIFRILNSKDDHHFKNYFIKNRNVRNHSQNKIGHHDHTMGLSSHTQKFIIYVSIDIYNKLPRNITLIENQILFKKCLKHFHLDKNVKLKNQNDYTKIDILHIIDQDLILRCYTDVACDIILT